MSASQTRQVADTVGLQGHVLDLSGLASSHVLTPLVSFEINSRGKNLYVHEK